MTHIRDQRIIVGMTDAQFQAPFPWFGGKSRVAQDVWIRFGHVDNYVEPFAGSLATLLGRPGWQPGIDWTETVNDKDGYICNFWRAVRDNPIAVAEWADHPINENDKHARHLYLVQQRDQLVYNLETDMDYYDPKIAGMWVWGICMWIGGGFCASDAPSRQLPHLGGDRGVLRRSHTGLERQIHGHPTGVLNAVPTQAVRASQNGTATADKPSQEAGTGALGIYAWMDALASRLRRVRVASGDWARVTTPSITTFHGLTAVFLDPPYDAQDDRDQGGYVPQNTGVAALTRQWAIENGDNPQLRIALCGYDGDYEMPEDWEVFQWSAQGGFATTDAALENRHRERIWFSPHCNLPDPVFGQRKGKKQRKLTAQERHRVLQRLHDQHDD